MYTTSFLNIFSDSENYGLFTVQDIHGLWYSHGHSLTWAGIENSYGFWYSIVKLVCWQISTVIAQNVYYPTDNK